MPKEMKFLFLSLLLILGIGAGFGSDSKYLESFKGNFIIEGKTVEESIKFVNSFLKKKKVKLNIKNQIGLNLDISQARVTAEINGSLDDVVLYIRQKLKESTEIDFKITELKDEILLEPDVYHVLVIQSDAQSGISYLNLNNGRLSVDRILALNDSTKNEKSYELNGGKFLLKQRTDHIDELIKKDKEITKEGLKGYRKFFEIYKILYLKNINCYIMSTGPDGHEFLNRTRVH